jgi:hypothetical protein
MKMLLQSMAESFMQMIGVERDEDGGSVATLTVPEFTLADLDIGYDVLTLPMKSPVVLRAFLAHHEDVVNDYALKCLTMAVTKKMPEVVLFCLGESDYLAIIEAADYGDQLMSLYDYYLRQERYDKAGQCNRLWKQYQIDQVIAESAVMAESAQRAESHDRNVEM